MNEFRDIPGFEGYYMVSINDGRIKSADIVITCKNGHVRMHKGRILKPSPLKDRNHLQLNLCKDGIQYHTYVHDVVAKTFPEICGKWFEGCIVHHKDGNPYNNSPYNLIVLSRKDHMSEHRDTIRTASNSVDRHGTVNGHAKTTLVYTENFDVVGCFDTATEAANYLGCSPELVMRSAKLTNYKAKGFYCEYL